jgi:hypothetical protein
MLAPRRKSAANSCVCVCEYVSVIVCVCECMYMLYACMHTICTYIRIYIYIYTYIGMYICIYLFIVEIYLLDWGQTHSHMETYMYTYIRIYILHFWPIYAHMGSVMRPDAFVCVLMYVHVSWCMYTCPDVCIRVLMYVYDVYMSLDKCMHMMTYLREASCTGFHFSSRWTGTWTGKGETCTNLYVYICVFIHNMYTCMYVYMIYIHVCMYTYMYECMMHTCVCMCISMHA